MLTLEYRQADKLGRLRAGNWMQTYSGGAYWPLDPRPDDVHLEDIAHHLSMLVRYTGAVREFYSVAEHSVLVSYMVPERYALEALLHDATEAYMNDVARPLKASLDDYRFVEARNWRAIADAFGLDHQLPECVKVADSQILHAEREQLLAPAPMLWGMPEDNGERPHISCWVPRVARAQFAARFIELWEARSC